MFRVATLVYDMRRHKLICLWRKARFLKEWIFFQLCYMSSFNKKFLSVKVYKNILILRVIIIMYLYDIIIMY